MDRRCLMVAVKSLTTHSCSSPRVLFLLLSHDLNSCWGFLILFLLASSQSSFGKFTSSLRPPFIRSYPVGSKAHHNRYTYQLHQARGGKVFRKVFWNTTGKLRSDVNNLKNVFFLMKSASRELKSVSPVTTVHICSCGGNENTAPGFGT